MHLMMSALPWIAVIIASLGYWFQIYRIVKHNEVRDLSLGYFWFESVSYALFLYIAIQEKTQIFAAKQLMTLIPALIIIAMIYTFRGERWYEDGAVPCSKCQKDLELAWDWCPSCGKNSREDS